MRTPGDGLDGIFDRRGPVIAAAVVFLASPAAAYVTGTTLHVNGGMYMS